MAPSNTDDSTSALGAANSGDTGNAQTGETNVNVPNAQVALAGKDAQTGNGNTVSDASSSANAVGDALNSTGSGPAANDGNAFGGLLDTGAAGTSNAQGGAANANYAGVGNAQGGALNANADNTSTSQSGLGTANSTSGDAINVPDATVQALGKNMADKGGVVTDDSVSAVGSAAKDGSNAQTATAAANNGSSSVGFTTVTTGGGGVTQQQQQQQQQQQDAAPAAELATDGQYQGVVLPQPVNNNGAAGGSTAVQIDRAAVPYLDSGVIGGAGVPGNNVQAGTTDSTQVNGDKNAIGEGSVAQDGKFNINMPNTGTNTSPVQVRDTSADDSAVAMDEGTATAQNADGGGTNVLVTDPSLALAGRDATSGDNSPLTDESTSANALGAAANDHSIATSADAGGDGSNAQNGVSNANGGSTAQTGLQNAANGSTAQNGEINNNGSGTASDQEANGGGGVNQGGSGVNVNVPNQEGISLAGQDAVSGQNNTNTDNSTNGNGGAAANNGSNSINLGGIPAGALPKDGSDYGTNIAQGTNNNAQQGDTNFNANLAGSSGTDPIQMRSTSTGDGATAMDEGIAQSVGGNGNVNTAANSGVQQQGTTNVYVPDAAIAGHDAVTGGSTLHRQQLQRPGPRHCHRQCRRHHQPHPGADA